jgi:hypothetical protein
MDSSLVQPLLHMKSGQLKPTVIKIDFSYFILLRYFLIKSLLLLDLLSLLKLSLTVP